MMFHKNVYTFFRMLGLLLLTTSALLFTACSNSTDNESLPVEFTYQEERIDLPSDMSDILSMEFSDNGRLLMIGSNEDASSHFLCELYDDSWEKIFDLQKELPIKESQYISSAVISKDEEVLVIAVDTANSEHCFQLFSIDIRSDNKYREIDSSLMKALQSHTTGEFTNTVTATFSLNDNKFVIQDAIDNLYIIDTSTETTTRLNLDERYNSLQLMAVTSFADSFIALCEDTEDGAIHGYSFLESEATTFAPLDKELLDNLSFALEENDKFPHFNVLPCLDSNSNTTKTTVCLNSGIFDLSTKELKKIIDAENTVLSDPSLTTIGCMADNTDSFYLACVNFESNENIIFKYTKGATSTDENVELRVYSLRDSAEVRQAISLFRSENPQINVTLEIGLSSDQTAEDDALRALNTELMAGGGPDVLFLDGLPIQSFIDNGVLYDISKIYDDAIQSDGYYNNVISSYKYEEGCWAIPMRFSFPTIITPKSIANKTDSLSILVNLTEDHVKESSASSIFCDQAIFESIFVSTYPTLIEKGELNEDALEDLFTNTKRISVQLELASGQDSVYPTFEYSASYNNHTHSNGFHYALRSFLSNPNQVLITSILDEKDFSFAKAVQENVDSDITVEVLSLEGKSCFTPSAIVSINSASKKIEPSEKFVKLLLDNNYQSNNQNEGLSISKSVLESKTSEDVAIFFSEQDYIYSESFSTESLRYYSALLSSLDTPINIDSKVKAIIYEQLQQYLDEEITLEEAVSACVLKVNLYLSE